MTTLQTRPLVASRENPIELNDEQIRLLVSFSPEFRERQIEVHYTGVLVVVDTFFVGRSRGSVRCICKPCWTAIAATPGGGSTPANCPSPRSMCLTKRCCRSLKLMRLGFTILSDNGREFCRQPDHHPCEQFLQLEGIEHRTTKVCRPQSNGFIERLHRTLLDEHFRIKERTVRYETVEQMQTDLDSYPKHYYNTLKSHQSRMIER